MAAADYIGPVHRPVQGRKDGFVSQDPHLGRGSMDFRPRSRSLGIGKAKMATRKPTVELGPCCFYGNAIAKQGPFSTCWIKTLAGRSFGTDRSGLRQSAPDLDLLNKVGLGVFMYVSAGQQISLSHPLIKAVLAVQGDCWALIEDHFIGKNNIMRASVA
jgi:hypothetical protein